MPSTHNNETSNSTSGSNSMMESILPSTTQDPKTYNLNGYLPFTSSITFTIDDNSFCDIMTHWFKLISESVSNWTENSNNTFSFDLTQNYDVYFEAYPSHQTPEFSETTFSVTQKLTDVTFASTVLSSLSNTLNSNNSQITLNAGWYVSKCTADVYSSNDFANLQQGISIIKNMLHLSGATNTTHSNSPTSQSTITGSTTFSNPTTSNQINSPITTDFYHTFANFLANTTSNTLSSNKEFTAKNNWPQINNSNWLGSFAMNGLAGYALNNQDTITSNSVNNPNESLIDNLKTPTLFEVNVNFATSNGEKGTNGPNSDSSKQSSPKKVTPIPPLDVPTLLTGNSYNNLNQFWNTTWQNFQSHPASFSAWMKQNLEQYAANAPTYFNELATQYDTLTNASPTLENISSNSSAKTSSTTYSTAGYLPFYTSQDSLNSDSINNYWIKLTSVQLSDWSETNNTYNFTLTWHYDVYTVAIVTVGSKEQFHYVDPFTWDVTQTIEGAKFGETLLSSKPISNLLTSNLANLSAGWYMSSCTSNTYSSMDVYDYLNTTQSNVNNFDSNFISTTNPSATYAISGATSFNNLTSSSFFANPIISGLYYVFSTDYAKIYHQADPKTKKIFVVSDTYSGFSTNKWLSTFITGGLAGYAYSNKKQISSPNAVQNNDTSLKNDLTSPLSISLSASVASSSTAISSKQ